MKLPYRRNRHREPKFIETSETLVWDLGAHPEAQGGGGIGGGGEQEGNRVEGIRMGTVYGPGSKNALKGSWDLVARVRNSVASCTYDYLQPTFR